jgi:hypothetical protein
MIPWVNAIYLGFSVGLISLAFLRAREETMDGATVCLVTGTILLIFGLRAKL